MKSNYLNITVFSVGLILASVGAGLVYLPAGLIVPGLILMAISLFGDPGDQKR